MDQTESRKGRYLDYDTDSGGTTETLKAPEQERKIIAREHLSWAISILGLNDEHTGAQPRLSTATNDRLRPALGRFFPTRDA